MHVYYSLITINNVKIEEINYSSFWEWWFDVNSAGLLLRRKLEKQKGIENKILHIITFSRGQGEK